MNRLLRVRRVISDHEIEYFELKIMVYPSNATFKGNLILRNKMLHVYGDVKRISLYRKESSCISDYALHGFCLCSKTLSH